MAQRIFFKVEQAAAPFANEFRAWFERSKTLDASIILCTSNRADALKLSLQSLLQVSAPPQFTWEVLIVDNRSTDDTRSICEALVAEHPEKFRYFYEPRRGKSYALNSGIRRTRGKLLIFTDDDCIVDSRWLQAICEEFAADPGLAILGGRVELYNSEDGPVSTLKSRERAVVSSSLQLLFPRVALIGCNMAIRRHVFDAVGLFDPNLGPGSRGESCEDIDFLYRALKHGFKIAYSPLLVVYHNHGRRTDADVQRTMGIYFISRGAFYCLHWGDKDIRRMAYRDTLFIARTLRWHLARKGVLQEQLFLARKLLTGALRMLLRKLPADEENIRATTERCSVS